MGKKDNKSAFELHVEVDVPDIIKRAISRHHGTDSPLYIPNHIEIEDKRSGATAILDYHAIPSPIDIFNFNIPVKLLGSYTDNDTKTTHKTGLVFDDSQDRPSVIGSLHLLHQSAKRGRKNAVERDVAAQLNYEYMVKVKGLLKTQATTELTKLFKQKYPRNTYRIKAKKSDFVFLGSGEDDESRTYIIGYEKIIDYSVSKTEISYTSSIWGAYFMDTSAEYFENVKFTVHYDHHTVPKILQLLRNACQK
jgi:hypothetical protein